MAYLVLDDLDSHVEEVGAVQVDVSSLEERPRASVRVQQVVVLESGIIDVCWTVLFKPRVLHVRNAIFEIVFRNAVPDLLEEPESLHLNLDCRKLLAKKSLFDILRCVLRKVPRHDSTPSLWRFL